MAALRKPKVGDVIEGKYKLEVMIGEGGMGQVYRAMHLVLGRAVAVKVMPLEHAKDERLVQRFLQEAHAAAKVRHPHIVEVLDAGARVDGSPYIVQELLEGETLDKLMERRGGQLEAREALKLLLPIVDAIAALHEAGIIHRDIKPENVFLAKSGGDVIPKLLDFGISREIESEVRLTTTGTAMGTPAYMSPEQVNGRKMIDARSDIWAVGVVLYELVSGRLPFEGETAPAMFGAIANTEPIPLEFAAPETPTSVVGIVRRCLERSPASRYRSARDLEDAMSTAHSRLLRQASVADTSTADLAAPPSTPQFDLPAPPPRPKQAKPAAAMVQAPDALDAAAAMMLGHELPNAGSARSPHERSGLELSSMRPDGKRPMDRVRGGLRRDREHFSRDPFGAWYVGAAILSATTAASTVLLSAFVEGPDPRLLISSATMRAMDTTTFLPHVLAWTTFISFGLFMVSSVGLWPRAFGRTVGYAGVVLMTAVWAGIPLASLFGSGTVASDVVEKGAIFTFVGIGIEIVWRAVEWWSQGRMRVFPVVLTGVAATAFFCVLRIAHVESPRAKSSTLVIPTVDQLPTPPPVRRH